MRRWWCLALVLFALTGCGLFKDTRIDAKQSEVTGTWRDPDTGIELVLSEAMTFETSDAALHFRGCTSCLPEGLAVAVKGSGTWELGPPTGKKSGPKNYVHLTFTKVENDHLAKYIPSTRGVRVERDPEGTLVLSAYDGNAETGYGHILYKTS